MLVGKSPVACPARLSPVGKVASPTEPTLLGKRAFLIYYTRSFQKAITSVAERLQRPWPKNQDGGLGSIPSRCYCLFFSPQSTSWMELFCGCALSKRSPIDGCVLQMVAIERRQGNGESPLQLTLSSFCLRLVVIERRQGNGESPLQLTLGIFCPNYTLW